MELLLIVTCGILLAIYFLLKKILAEFKLMNKHIDMMSTKVGSLHWRGDMLLEMAHDIDDKLERIDKAVSDFCNEPVETPGNSFFLSDAANN